MGAVGGLRGSPPQCPYDETIPSDVPKVTTTMAAGAVSPAIRAIGIAAQLVKHAQWHAVKVVQVLECQARTRQRVNDFPKPMDEDIGCCVRDRSGCVGVVGLLIILEGPLAEIRNLQPKAVRRIGGFMQKIRDRAGLGEEDAAAKL